MTGDKYKFDLDMERLLTYYVTSNISVYNSIGQYLNPALMNDGTCQKLVEITRWVVKNRLAGKAPGSSLLIKQRIEDMFELGTMRQDVYDELKGFLDLYEGTANLAAPKHVISMVKNCVKAVENKQVVLGLVNNVPKGDIDNSSTIRTLSAVDKIGEIRVSDYITLDTLAARLRSKTAEEPRLLVGIDALDQNHMNHTRKSLALVVAPTGVGKSTFLNQVATSCMLQKYNVFFATLELTSDQAVKRLLGGLTYRETNSLTSGSESLEDSLAELARLQETGNLGYVHTEYLAPDLYTVADIEEKYDEAETRLGLKFDVVIVDWDAKIKITEESVYKGMGKVYDALDQLGKDKNVWVWIAAQARRQDAKFSQGTKESGIRYLDTNDVADSLNKCRTATVVITLNPIGDGKLVFNICKNRGGPAKILSDYPVDTIMDKGLICKRSDWVDLPLTFRDNIDIFKGE